MRLVDAEAKGLLMELFTYRRYTGIDEAPIETAIDAIHQAPTVDAVQVVRCKDCKWHLNGHLCKQLSQYGSIETPPSFYCGFAERR